jgi:hypothetical protein
MGCLIYCRYRMSNILTSFYTSDELCPTFMVVWHWVIFDEYGWELATFLKAGIIYQPKVSDLKKQIKHCFVVWQCKEVNLM